MTVAKIRLGMAGGGVGSFIGPMHHLGAHLSGGFTLVAGAFSGDLERSRAAGAQYGVAPDRCYAGHDALIAGERGRPDGIEALAIATPNHLHFPAAMAALDAGLHIMSDKPATATLAEAQRLRDALASHDSLYALTFTYSGFPMIREARARVAAGMIGAVRKVAVSFAQGWLAAPLEQAGNARAAWRMDPARSGVGGCISDIGTHAFHLAEYVTGDRVSEIVADLHTHVPGRALDDDANMLLHFAGGASGVLASSQVAVGERLGFTLQIFGEKGAMHWAAEQPETLRFVGADGAVSLLSPMSPGLLVREPLPPGFGGSILAGFAVQYRDFARAIRGERGLIGDVLPGIEAGVRTMRFVEAAVHASAARAGWTELA